MYLTLFSSWWFKLFSMFWLLDFACGRRWLDRNWLAVAAPAAPTTSAAAVYSALPFVQLRSQLACRGEGAGWLNSNPIFFLFRFIRLSRRSHSSSSSSPSFSFLPTLPFTERQLSGGQRNSKKQAAGELFDHGVALIKFRFLIPRRKEIYQSTSNWWQSDKRKK